MKMFPADAEIRKYSIAVYCVEIVTIHQEPFEKRYIVIPPPLAYILNVNTGINKDASRMICWFYNGNKQYVSNCSALQ